ncbi:hypothetical protein NDU88_003289 [Pleurodeles waltl]|uniref:Uncharacterized protein n=1 Tax=Pleurodeles waltl TaxID=8319 RepID=A0AAV7WSE1_PLEWA|nr:hypothetical protein NDU88_003289 [Pleurodeles waltl]
MGLTGPRGTSGGGLPDPEVLCASHGETDAGGSTGPFKSPKHTGGAVTTGRGSFLEPNDCIAEEDDHSQLLHLEKGTRRKQRVGAGHALERVAEPAICPHNEGPDLGLSDSKTIVYCPY